MNIIVLKVKFEIFRQGIAFPKKKNYMYICWTLACQRSDFSSWVFRNSTVLELLTQKLTKIIP